MFWSDEYFVEGARTHRQHLPWWKMRRCEVVWLPLLVVYRVHNPLTRNCLICPVANLLTMNLLRPQATLVHNPTDQSSVMPNACQNDKAFFYMQLYVTSLLEFIFCCTVRWGHNAQSSCCWSVTAKTDGWCMILSLCSCLHIAAKALWIIWCRHSRLAGPRARWDACASSGANGLRDWTHYWIAGLYTRLDRIYNSTVPSVFETFRPRCRIDYLIKMSGISRNMEGIVLWGSANQDGIE